MCTLALTQRARLGISGSKIDVCDKYTYHARTYELLSLTVWRKREHQCDYSTCTSQR